MPLNILRGEDAFINIDVFMTRKFTLTVEDNGIGIGRR